LCGFRVDLPSAIFTLPFGIAGLVVGGLITKGKSPQWMF
jgi:hypothetical protein